MRIAFDAKRAFMNNTGLGQYSRNLLRALAEGFPQHEYWLASPKVTGLFEPPPGMHTLSPQGLYRLLPSVWRSGGMVGALARAGVELYHGLSHELPVGLAGRGIKSVVTMHDLVFERYPEQYKAVDVAVYRKKFRYACTHADRVIAISQQTKQDLVELYHVPPEKIRVCYQSCNPAFGIAAGDEERARVRAQYGLPEQYLLYVGSVIERKNLLTICKAMAALKGTMDLPLAVIGKGGDYMQRVQLYVREHGLQDRVLWLSERPGGVSGADMPAIYQGARAMLYPSVYEGFGIPVLEALWSGVPVVTSNTSCLPETGGDAAYYIDPLNVGEMAEALLHMQGDQILRSEMIRLGREHAERFSPQACAAAVMGVYEEVSRES